MNFSEALEGIKQGKRLARSGWNGKDMFIFLVGSSPWVVGGHKTTMHAYIAMKTAQGYVIPWLASQADLLADDWEGYNA